MGNEVDILVLLQSIARICMLFGVCVLWSEPVYRFVTLLICCIKISAYFSKRANKRTSLAKTPKNSNTD